MLFTTLFVVLIAATVAFNIFLLLILVFTREHVISDAKNVYFGA